MHIKKGQPQQSRESFAAALREQGIDAEATPRQVRGIVKKAVKQSIIHIRENKKASRTDIAKFTEIVNAQDTEDSSIWEKKIKARQTVVRNGWLIKARALLQGDSTEDKSITRKIMAFVNAMPRDED